MVSFLAKADVMSLGIQPASREQVELDLGDVAPERGRSRLMKAMDSVNGRWGKGAVKVGSRRVGRRRATEA